MFFVWVWVFEVIFFLEELEDWVCVMVRVELGCNFNQFLGFGCLDVFSDDGFMIVYVFVFFLFFVEVCFDFEFSILLFFVVLVDYWILVLSILFLFRSFLLIFVLYYVFILWIKI